MVDKGTEIIVNSRGDTHLVTNAWSSPLVSRQQYFRLGKSFNGERDYYQVLGYDLEPEVDDFLARYTRDDIAGRIVDLPPQDTWKKRPILIDGDSRSDDDEPGSPFIKAWQSLTDTDGDEAINAYQYFERIDRLSGIGRFGVLVIGVRDGGNLDEPIERKLAGPQDILYLRACSEFSVMLNPTDIDRNPLSRRFGKPVHYSINIDNTSGAGLYTRVHWSRCIHVAEDLLEDEVFGRPRLERILNRLDDLMKIVGGSSEATWKLMRKGVAFIAREGYKMPQDTTTKNDVNTQLEEYDHGLRRILRLAGVDVEELGSDVVDPTGLFNVIISLIAAASDIPQRILIGSERGELASTQDQGAWQAVISNRQTNFAEPSILRAFVNWCIRNGVLPTPTTGKYKVEWPQLYELTKKEESEVAYNLSRAIAELIQATGAVDLVSIETLLEKVLKLPFEAGMIEEEETEEDEEIFREMRQLPMPAIPQNGQPVMNGGR